MPEQRCVGRVRPLGVLDEWMGRDVEYVVRLGGAHLESLHTRVYIRTHVADVDDAQRLARALDEHQRQGQWALHIPEFHHERAVGRPLLLSVVWGGQVLRFVCERSTVCNNTRSSGCVMCVMGDVGGGVYTPVHLTF